MPGSALLGRKRLQDKGAERPRRYGKVGGRVKAQLWAKSLKQRALLIPGAGAQQVT